ncbi:MAG: GNAT family N-acetyltransferase, partial [Opitutales bacterium]
MKNFKTSRLILKKVSQNDIPSYKKHFVNYEIIKHLSSAVPWPYPNDGVEWFINNQIIPFQGI